MLGRWSELAHGHTDIHSHVLAGIDDGPRTIDESLAMARAAAEAGTSTLVATPHLHASFPDVRIEQIAERCHQLQTALNREGVGLDVVPGGEIALGWALDASDEQLSLASYAQRGHDLLLELPFTHAAGADHFIYRLQSKGYRVILAHPERYRSFQRDQAQLHALVEQGVLLQVNAESLLAGGSSRGVRSRARQLLSDGLAHVIASDGHRATTWRPVTRLAEAVEAAAELIGPERAEWMVSAAPHAIVSGTPLPEPPPVARKRKGRWFFGLR